MWRTHEGLRRPVSVRDVSARTLAGLNVAIHTTAAVQQQQNKPAVLAENSSMMNPSILQTSLTSNHQNNIPEQDQINANLGGIINGTRSSTSLDSESDFNFVEQVIQHSTKIDPTTGILSQPSSSRSISNSATTPQQCFICPNGPWFKSNNELNQHISLAHLDIDVKPPNIGDVESNSNLEVLSVADLEASFLTNSNDAMTTSDLNPIVKDLFDDSLGKSTAFNEVGENVMNGGSDLNKAGGSLFESNSALQSLSNPAKPSLAKPATTPSISSRAGLPTGRPCEICGFEKSMKSGPKCIFRVSKCIYWYSP